MEILEPIRKRRSVRAFQNTPIDQDLIDRMLESARLAPSGNNSQPWHFILITSKSGRLEIARACHNQIWMAQAPLLIACVADRGARSKVSPGGEAGRGEGGALPVREDSPDPLLKKVIRDTAIAVDHLVLQAESMGLGTCWIAWFKQDDLRPLLKIPADKYVVAVVCVGIAAGRPKPVPRKPRRDMVHYEAWGRQKT